MASKTDIPDESTIGPDRFALLTVAEMYEADRLAMESYGIPGEALMEAAGRALAEAVLAGEPKGRVLVLCGPGNNGGDGFVAARFLQDAGWSVSLALLGPMARLSGDAALHAARWQGPVSSLEEVLDCETDIVVDALFGAGLTRALAGSPEVMAKRTTALGIPVYAVDVPSGLSGDSGLPLGPGVFKAKKTVTFFRMKPGHLLLPGRNLCGEVILADIGIPEETIARIAPKAWHNEPALWVQWLPRRRNDSHKYHFGHALLVGGPEMVGASILAARAALRVGAGLVTLVGTPLTWPIQAAALPSVICRRASKPSDLEALLADRRLTALLYGPGAGTGAKTRNQVSTLAAAGKKLVLDADALTAFADDPAALFALLAETSAVLTPHDGEFGRLFPDLGARDKVTRARLAAQRANATIVLKGADTVVAAPDGRVSIADNGPPWLATAGSGDVLAGLIVGILAQGLAPFEAASSGVWIHGAGASCRGPGMIAEDLPECVPTVLTRLFRQSE